MKIIPTLAVLAGLCASATLSGCVVAERDGYYHDDDRDHHRGYDDRDHGGRYYSHDDDHRDGDDHWR